MSNLTESKAFGPEVRRHGGYTRDLKDIRGDTENAFYRLEKKADYPKIEWIESEWELGEVHINVIGQNLPSQLVAHGENLDLGQAKTTIGSGNTLMTLYAVGGLAGNKTKIKVVVPTALNQPYSVSWANSLLTINIATDGAGAPVPKLISALLDDIKTATSGAIIGSAADETKSYSAAVSEKYFADGVGSDAISFRVADEDVDIDRLSSTACRGDCPALENVTAGAWVNCYIEVNGYRTHPITVLTYEVSPY